MRSRYFWTLEGSLVWMFVKAVNCGWGGFGELVVWEGVCILGCHCWGGGVLLIGGCWMWYVLRLEWKNSFMNIFSKKGFGICMGSSIRSFELCEATANIFPQPIQQ